MCTFSQHISTVRRIVKLANYCNKKKGPCPITEGHITGASPDHAVLLERHWCLIQTAIIHLWSEHPRIALRARSRVGHVKYCGLGRDARPATPSACLSQSLADHVTIQSGNAVSVGDRGSPTPRAGCSAGRLLTVVCWIGTNASGALGTHNLCRNLKIPTNIRASEQPDCVGRVEFKGPRERPRWWCVTQDARAGQEERTGRRSE